MHTKDQRLIARFCKAYVLKEMRLNPRVFRQTRDEAWIAVATRLLRQQPSRRHELNIRPRLVGARTGK